MELLYTRRYKINKIVSFISAFAVAVVTAGIGSSHFAGLNMSYHMRALTGISVFFMSELYFTRKYRRRKVILHRPVPEGWDEALTIYVPYYRLLSEDDKFLFSKKIEFFLDGIVITGIDTKIDEVTRLLVGAAAVIPVFRQPEWEYDYLTDVFVCSDNLADNIELLNCCDDVLGLVVYNKSSIYLSREALVKNFMISDGNNVGIHEFIHKIDEVSGSIDGILPAPFLSKKEREKWLGVIDYEMSRLKRNDSDFKEYALRSRSEFIAVAAEYFFERPLEMKEKHFRLYAMMQKMFRQDLASAFSRETKNMFKE